MAADRIEAIRTLLARAEEAHGAYERTELGGAYDQDWPAWYAAWAVDHGIDALVGHAVTADQLAAFLTDANAAYQEADPKPTEPWAVSTARRIAAEV